MRYSVKSIAPVAKFLYNFFRQGISVGISGKSLKNSASKAAICATPEKIFLAGFPARAREKPRGSSPSASGGAPGVRISDKLGIVRHVSPPEKRHLGGAPAASKSLSERDFPDARRQRRSHRPGRRPPRFRERVRSSRPCARARIRRAAASFTWRSASPTSTRPSTSSKRPSRRSVRPYALLAVGRNSLAAFDRRRLCVGVPARRTGLRTRERRHRPRRQADHLEHPVVAARSGRRIRLFRSGLSGLRLRCELSSSRRAGDSAARRAQWRMDLDELERRVNAKTKAIVINSPHNPTGGVLENDDLARSRRSRAATTYS